MKNYYIIFFFFLSSIILYGQQYEDKSYYLIDSLDLSQSNTQSLNLLNQKLEAYHAADTDSLRIIAIAEFVNESIDNHIRFKYNDYVINTAKKTLSHDSINMYVELLGIAYGNKAYYFQEIKHNPDSIDFYINKSSEVLKNADDQSHYAHTLLKQGVGAYFDLEINKAVEYINDAIAICEKEEDYLGLTLGYNYLALIILNYESVPKGLALLDLAYTNAEKAGLPSQMVQALTLKLEYSENAEDMQEVITLVNQAIKICEQSEESEACLDIYILAANRFLELEQYDKAAYYSNLYLNSSAGSAFPTSMENAYYVLAAVALENSELNKGLSYANKALELKNHDKSRIDTYEIMYKLYEAKKDYPNAYKWSKNYIDLVGDVFDAESKNEVIRKSLKYQLKKEQEIEQLKIENEIAELENKKEVSNIISYASAGFAGLILIFSLILGNRYNLIKSQKKDLNLAFEELEVAKKNELAVSNLKALQSQMNPHFIFNALNSVQDLVLLKDIRNSNKYLGRFSELIRKILLSSKKQFITLGEELDILKLYLDLEKLRFGDDFTIDLQVKVPEDLIHKIQLPSMFIQPFIENAIKHGLFHKKGHKKLEVIFDLDGDKYLECVIRDNGVGRDAAHQIKQKDIYQHANFSSQAIEDRIHLLNQILNPKIKMQIDDLHTNGNASGTQVTLKFPI